LSVLHVLSAARTEGEFSLKVVFYKHRLAAIRTRMDPADVLFESPVVSFRVKPLPQSDPINRLMTASQIRQLPWATAFGHYYGRVSEQLGTFRADLMPESGGETPGRAVWEKFGFPRADVERILPQAVDSVFHESLLYGMILGTASPTDLQKATNAIKGQSFAEEFIRRYPQSWLLPEVYKRLFDCHVTQRKYPEALKTAETAMKLDGIHPLYENIGFSNQVERVRQRMVP
jgi:hypothetical protein